MSGSLNKVTIIGRLGKDPESRSFQNGGGVTNLSIATSESWKDRNTGEKKEKTEWHNVAVFSEGLRGVCERYLRKGSSVYIEGKLQTRKWQDNNGNDRYTTEIVLQGFDSKLIMLSGQNQGQGGGQQSGGWGAGQSGGGQRGGGDGFGARGGNYNDGGAGSGWNSGGSGGSAFDNDLDDEVPF